MAKCPAEAPKVLDDKECVLHCDLYWASEYKGNCYHDCSTINKLHYEHVCVDECPKYTK